jgi:hypothetical protein
MEQPVPFPSAGMSSDIGAQGDYSEAERACREVMALPIYPK